MTQIGGRQNPRRFKVGPCRTTDMTDVGRPLFWLLRVGAEHPPYDSAGNTLNYLYPWALSV